ncbi:deoxycytidyl transferase [Tulasnella sp. 403]|nr:deoxycytidyl transferase [Tulasnella sp. 403]
MKGKPVVVCHSRGGKASTSEIASASYEARAFGIKNGMSLGQARQLCPEVQTIPYEFETYKQFSLKFYTILMSVADDLQAVSVDEALIDVSERVALAQAGDENPDRDHAKELAETIRDKIREETRCEVSVGISHNIMLARLATRRAKPAGSYHLLPADVPEHLAPLGVGAVHGIGSSIRDKIREKFNLETLGELLSKSKESLQRVLGEKTGEKMWKAARGIDDTQLESDKPRKSVSAEVNYGIRFENNEQAENFIYTLSGEVSKRLKAVNKRGKLLTLKVMVRSKDAPKEAAKFLGHGMVDCFNRSTAIGDARGGATDDEQIIGKETWKLLKAFNFDPTELRGIGIQIQKLDDEAKAEGDAELPPGQSRLQFTKTANEAKASESKAPRATGRVEADAIDVDEIEEEPPPKPRPKSSSRPPTGRSTLALPSASQIDTTVLESLPEDIRAEILANLDQAAAGPSKVLEKRANTAPASPPVEVIELVDSEDDDVAVRSQSVPIGGSQERDALVVPQAHKATSTSPTKAARSERSDTKSKASFKVPASKTANVSRITKQLAPKRKIPIASPTKINIFKPRQTSVVDISDRELQSLGVDPKTFRELPADVQKEQISLLKQNAREGSVPHGRGGLLSVPGSRAGSRSRSPSLALKPRAPAPIPVAQYTELPQIKKLSKLDDIQDMIKEWVQYRKVDGPIPAEVERISGFLVKCARSDVGLERATAVLRYWRIVLRQKWEAEEAPTHVIDLDMDAAGRAWWDAFRRTKRKVDEVVRGRFGCNLSLGR